MAKEKTIAEKLKALYQLQLIDSKLDEIQILKGELPIEVKDLEDEISGLKTRIQRLERQIEDIEDSISMHRSKIKEAEALIERYNKQLDEVKNNREYEALMKEIELQRLEIQLAEKRIRDATQQLEARQELLENTKQRLEAKKHDLEVKQKELEEVTAKNEKEEKKLKRQSEKARKEIDPRWLRSYDKIRANYRNGLAVVMVERDACGGCHNTIPPQTQLELTLRTEIITCEHCGRILVDDNILYVGEEPPAPQKEEVAPKRKTRKRATKK